MKKSIDFCKTEKQKKTWEVKQLDFKIKDLVEKVGNGYLLTGAATYQKGTVHSLST